MKGLNSGIALLILAVTNAFVFGGILWNRSGEATGTITFDQCELNSFKSWAGRHETPRYVSLNFASVQVDGESLEEFGGYDEDGKSLARRGYVVAKHGGPEWQEFLERRNRLERYSGVDSKLILVDGGSDLEVLLEKYPAAEGRAILPGYVDNRYWVGSALNGGYHWMTSVSRVSIASHYRETVRHIREARLAEEKEANEGSTSYVRPPCLPTHRITVKWGRRFEPWISEIEPL